MILPKDKSKRGWWTLVRGRSAEGAKGAPGPLTDKERQACVWVVAVVRRAGFTSGRSDFEGLERLQSGLYGFLAMFVFLILPWAKRQDHGLGGAIAWSVGVVLLSVLWWTVVRKLPGAYRAFVARRSWYLEEVTGDGVDSDAFRERKRSHGAAEKPVGPDELACHERALHRLFGKRKGGGADLEVLDVYGAFLAFFGWIALSSIRESLSTSAYPLPAVIFLAVGLLVGLLWGYVVWQVTWVKRFLVCHRAWNLADLAEGSAPDTQG